MYPIQTEYYLYLKQSDMFKLLLLMMLHYSFKNGRDRTELMEPIRA